MPLTYSILAFDVVSKCQLCKASVVEKQEHDRVLRRGERVLDLHHVHLLHGILHGYQRQLLEELQNLAR